MRARQLMIAMMTVVLIPAAACQSLLASQQSSVDGGSSGAMDTCVTGLYDFSRPNQPKHLRVYKSDGTVLVNLPADGATPSVAFSPDGQFIATASEFGPHGGAKVFSVATGKVVGQVSFPIATF